MGPVGKTAWPHSYSPLLERPLHKNVCPLPFGFILPFKLGKMFGKLNPAF